MRKTISKIPAAIASPPRTSPLRGIRWPLIPFPFKVPIRSVESVTSLLEVSGCPDSGGPSPGGDESLSTYLECLREDLLQGRLEEFVWVPTDSMLADGGSKVMGDVLAAALLRNGGWWPSEYKILFRTNVDGADE